jgi:WD40 repeat protein
LRDLAPSPPEEELATDSVAPRAPGGQPLLPGAIPHTLSSPGNETLPGAPAAPASGPASIDMAADDPRRYDLTDELGSGGLGRILEAYDRRLGRTIALKELLRPGPTERARFVREALITARLEHPAIIPVHDVGCWPSGETFYVMKRVSGRSLREVMTETRTLDERLALLPNLIAVADAMAYAHSHRVIHRDLKPANILIGPFGETVVIDWGLAKDLRSGDEDPAPTVGPEPLADEHLTRTGTILGTPAYMPPEQAEGRAVDERADVYTLGAILYELLSGRLPYQGGSRPDAVTNQFQYLDTSPPPIEQLQPGVPPDLAAVVRKAMARDPAARYRSAHEFAEDLRNFQTGRLVSAHHYSRPTLIGRWLRRNRVPVIITGLALMALMAGGLLSVRRIIAARRVAEHRAAELLLSQASGGLERDPTETLAWLRMYSSEPAAAGAGAWDEVRTLAIDATSRGVARHVLPKDGFHGFTADGRAWIDARGQEHIDLRDLASGALLRRLAAPEGIRWLRVAPDRRHLAILTQRQDAILLYDLATGRSERLTLGGTSIRELCFSPDGKYLATGDNGGAVQLWPLESGAQGGAADPRAGGAAGRTPRLIGRHQSAVLYLFFSRDGRWLISSSEESLTARLWEVEGPRRHEVTGPPRTRSVAELSPDDSHFAIGDREGLLTLVDVANGTSRRLDRHPAPIHDLHFSPDGTRLVTADDDGIIELWTLPAGERRRLIPRHATAAYRVGFTRDGRRLVSAGRDGEVRLWEIETGEYRTLGHVYGRVTSIELAPDDRHVAVVTLTSSARIWELPPHRGRTLHGPTDDVYQVLFSQDGKTLAATSRDLGLYFWRLPAGPAGALRGHRDTAYRIALSADGQRLYSASYDQTVRRWDLRPCIDLPPGVTPEPHSPSCRAEGQIILEHRSQTRSIALSPDGERLASGAADGAIRVWQEGKSPPRVLHGPRGIIRALAFLGDGQTLASGDERGELWLFDLTRAEGEGRLLPGTGKTIENLAYTRNGSLLAGADQDGSVRLWQLPTGALRVLGHHEGTAKDVAFSPDGQTLASAGEDGSVQLFELPSGQSRVLGRHRERVYRLAFSPDGSILASASQDRTVRLWNVATRSLLQILRHEHELTYVTFAPDGQTLAVAGTGGTVRLWPVDRTMPPSEPAAVRSWLLGLSTAILDPRQQLATPQ